MDRCALIVWGGWDGHEPQRVAELFARLLREDGFHVDVADSLTAFDDGERLAQLSLIVPHWTMGKISDEQCANVMRAVQSGVGLAGCHGGMCDAFRENTDWQFMTGGQWVAHPGDDCLKYTVRITDKSHQTPAGLKTFDVATEQYSPHVAPAVKVLASTTFPVAD